MAESLLDYLRVSPRQEQERRVSMAQIVEPDDWYIKRLHQLTEPAGQPVGGQVGSVGPGEDPVPVTADRTEAEAGFGLSCPVAL